MTNIDRLSVRIDQVLGRWYTAGRLDEAMALHRRWHAWYDRQPKPPSGHTYYFRLTFEDGTVIDDDWMTVWAPHTKKSEDQAIEWAMDHAERYHRRDDLTAVEITRVEAIPRPHP